MNTPILLDSQSIPPAAPFYLNVHLAVTLEVTADEACRRVNRQIIPDLGTGLIARGPQLVMLDQDIIWRVPVVLSLPGLGDLGQVGAIDIDARTGKILLDAAAQERIIQHAHWLYTGATLQAK
jgi:hypothetical protein